MGAKAPRPSRVAMVSSGAHWLARRVDLGNLDCERRYKKWIRYCETKLGDLLIMTHLAEHLLSKPISVLYYSFVVLKYGGICITLFDTMRLVNPYSPHTPSSHTSPTSSNTSPSPH